MLLKATYEDPHSRLFVQQNLLCGWTQHAVRLDTGRCVVGHRSLCGWTQHAVRLDTGRCVVRQNPFVAGHNTL